MAYERRTGPLDTFGRTFYTPTDRGFLTESFPGIVASSASLLPTAGRQDMVRLKLPQAASVTNIVIHLNTAGATLTAGQNFAALYTAAGALIAQSADQAASWAASTGLKSAALAGGPHALAAGEYYATFWYNGTTAPQLSRAMNIATGLSNGLTAAPNFLYAFNNAALTTTAPANLGTQASLGITWWVALS